jgi:hypothetical protein
VGEVAELAGRRGRPLLPEDDRRVAEPGRALQGGDAAAVDDAVRNHRSGAPLVDEPALQSTEGALEQPVARPPEHARSRLSGRGPDFTREELPVLVTRCAAVPVLVPIRLRQSGSASDARRDAYDELVAPALADQVSPLFERLCQRALPDLVDRQFRDVGQWWFKNTNSTFSASPTTASSRASARLH